MPSSSCTYRVVNDNLVRGTYLQAFIKNGSDFFVTMIEIYKDGMIECWGLGDFASFKQKIATGGVRTRLPKGAQVSMMLSMLHFTVTDVVGGVDELEFIKEVADELERLNDRPTSAQLCRASLLAYQQDPTTRNLQNLRVTYENVPAHMRRFLGDMDNKDSEYRQALGLSQPSSMTVP
jgi:hypothetical protein